MNRETIIVQYEKTIKELENISKALIKLDKVDLSDDNIYAGITFISKIKGLLSFFDEDFINDFQLKQLIEWIDKKLIMIEASHYTDKNLFYEFINVIYPQLKYRLGLIKYKTSLSKEDQRRLIITPEYKVYLYNLLKYYLEQQTSEETSLKINEILKIVNLYKVVNDKNIVALGSEITYMDSITNEVNKGRIVIDSHGDLQCHKLALNEYFTLLSSKVDDIVTLDYSTSYFIRILDVCNEEEKPTF